MAYSEPPPEETALNRVALVPIFRARPRLEWTDADGPHSVLIEHKIVVGSSPGAGIVISDPTVSRLHVELDPREDGLWARDVGSRNGTFLEGIQITGAKIPQGAKLLVGSTEFRVDHRAEKQPVDMWPEASFGRLIGGSPPMRELFAILARVAPMDASILVQGETGTGKELIARAIHDASPRASKPFIVVDCAALPENLLDAELFGHTRGAFTGAVAARNGAIETADGGTVFLDEVGELPIAMQPKLLRVLESRTVRRVGDTAHRPVNVRFISATHRDLLTMVTANEFREDLYFRLAVLPVTAPPLRDRRDDIELLVNHFWTSAGGEGQVSSELMRELVSRPWRGNVRELRNFVDRARALGAAVALKMMLQGAAAESAPAPAGGSRASTPSILPPAAPAPTSPDDAKLFAQTYKDFREQWIDVGEREYLRRLLERHNRHVAAAAREAEVDRTYIYRLIRKHDL